MQKGTQLSSVMLRRIFGLLLCVFVLMPHQRLQATFYGSVPTGYQWIQIGNFGYGLYVPKTFDPEKEIVIIFAIGRTDIDGQLTPHQVEGYVREWVPEAEKRGYIVISPFWQPVVVGAHEFAEQYYLGILDHAERTYSFRPDRTLLVGYGLGSAEAYFLGVLNQDRFDAIAAIAGSPHRDPIISSVVDKRQWRKFKRPVLLTYGEQAYEAEVMAEEDHAWLVSQGIDASIKAVPEMEYAQTSDACAVVLDWFDELSKKT